MPSRLKKIIKIILKAAIVFVIASMSVFFVEYYLFPRLALNSFFSRFDFFKKANEKSVVINRTEQIVVREGETVSELASKTSPSVVNIISFEKISGSGLQKKAADQMAKTGSGVTLTSDGLIATYRGVIIEENADYQVITQSGATLAAKLEGIDEFTNIAFLRVEASNLNVVPFANSDDFKPGRKILALGLSSQGEVYFASGLLSGVNKTFNISGMSVSSSEKMEGVFETDFVRDDRFAGGPLVSYNGEMVGLTGFVIIDNQKIFFQIPSNVVKNSMRLMINGELDKRPFLGLYYMPINAYIKLKYSISVNNGALVYSPRGIESLAVMAGSPAEKAGFRLGDVVLRVNNKEINAENPLSNLVSEIKKGENVEFLVLRSGKEITLRTQLK